MTMLIGLLILSRVRWEKPDSKRGDEAHTEEEAVVFVPRARRMQFN